MNIPIVLLRGLLTADFDKTFSLFQKFSEHEIFYGVAYSLGVLGGVGVENVFFHIC